MGMLVKMAEVSVKIAVIMMVATRAQGAPDPLGRAPHPRGPLVHRLALIPLPKIHIYSKKISVSFYPVWTLFDMDFL